MRVALAVLDSGLIKSSDGVGTSNTRSPDAESLDHGTGGDVQGDRDGELLSSGDADRDFNSVRRSRDADDFNDHCGIAFDRCGLFRQLDGCVQRVGGVHAINRQLLIDKASGPVNRHPGRFVEPAGKFCIAERSKPLGEGSRQSC